MFQDLDVNVTEAERAVRDTTHRFAEEVMRPVGQNLDKLDPEAVIASDSELWDLFRQYSELGLDVLGEGEAELTPLEQARIRYITSEEMGWGDAGLAIAFGVRGFPLMMAQLSGNPGTGRPRERQPHRLLGDHRAGSRIGCP